eukprot:9862011-Ditylum_brightwellii.AAC.1
MDRPHNATELCMLIGCVNSYQDIWPNRAHILKPLIDMSGSSDFQVGACIMQGGCIVAYYSK